MCPLKMNNASDRALETIKIILSKWIEMAFSSPKIPAGIRDSLLLFPFPYSSQRSSIEKESIPHLLLAPDRAALRKRSKVWVKLPGEDMLLSHLLQHHRIVC